MNGILIDYCRHKVKRRASKNKTK